MGAPRRAMAGCLALLLAAAAARAPVVIEYERPVELPADTLASAASVLLLPTGELLLSDTARGSLVVASADGRVIRRMGTPGSAPGQLNRPAHLAVIMHKDLRVNNVPVSHSLLVGERGALEIAARAFPPCPQCGGGLPFADASLLRRGRHCSAR